MPVLSAHKQTTAAVRATFRMATAHVCVRLMGSGLEMSRFVKVSLPHNILVESRSFQHWFIPLPLQPFPVVT